MATSLSKTVEQLNGSTHGAYRVTVKQHPETNEVIVRLYENTIRHAIASGYVDRGHTIESREGAAQEVAGLVNAYLRQS